MKRIKKSKRKIEEDYYELKRQKFFDPERLYTRGNSVSS
jgi:hypothetical protein